MTCSLELSKQLYGLGLRIETEKWWIPDIINDEISWRVDKYHSSCVEYFRTSRYIKIPAPSTDELLAVMPYKINNQHYLVIGKAFKGFIVRYFNYEKLQMYKTNADTLSEALGKMCLWLLENGWRWDDTSKLLVKGGGDEKK